MDKRFLSVLLLLIFAWQGCGRESGWQAVVAEDQAKPVSHWIAQGKRSDPKLRFEALEALKRMAPTDESAKTALRQLAQLELTRAGNVLQILEATGPHAKVAVPILAEVLRDQKEPWGIRAEISKVLGGLGREAKEAVPALIESLRDPEPGMRGAAARALAQIGAEAKPALPALVGLLRDPDPEVRRAAMEALGRKDLRSQEAVPLLKDLLKDQPVRVAAAVTLSKIGPEAAKMATAVLTDGLYDKQARLALVELGPETAQLATAYLVSRLEQYLATDSGFSSAQRDVREAGPDAVRAAVPLIRKLLGHENKEVGGGLPGGPPGRGPGGPGGAGDAERRQQWIEAMLRRFDTNNDGVISPNEVVDPRMKPMYEGIVRRANMDPSASIQISALRDAIGKNMGTPGGGPSGGPPGTAGGGRRPDQRGGPTAPGLGVQAVRQRALYAVAELGPEAKGLIPDLRAVLREKDDNLRQAAIRALGTLGAEAVPSLVEMLGDSDWRFRRAAASSLAGVGSEAKAAIPALVERLGDENSDVFREAALALRRIDPQASAKTAVPLLIARLRQDRDGPVAWTAIESLPAMRPESNAAIPILTEIATDKSIGFGNRFGAAKALAQMGPEAKGKGVAVLVEALRDPDGDARRAAILTLGQMGTEAAEAIPALKGLLQELSASVRQRLGSEQAVPMEWGVIKDSDAELRLLAAQALGRMGPEGAKVAMPILKGLLSPENPEVSLRVAWALLAMGPEGVEANVVFFTKGYPTEKVWIYDARSNVPGITKKDRPLVPEHFAEFERCFGADPNGRAKRKDSDSPAGKGYLGGDRWPSRPTGYFSGVAAPCRAEADCGVGGGVAGAGGCGPRAVGEDPRPPQTVPPIHPRRRLLQTTNCRLARYSDDN